MLLLVFNPALLICCRVLGGRDHIMASHQLYEWRARHRGVIVGESLYLLGGFDQRSKSTSCDHDNEYHDKKCSLKIFDFMSTKRLKTSVSKGAPPLATMYFSCCVIGREIYRFGGSCQLGSCFHNSLVKLTTEALTWKPVLVDPSLTNGGPMKKHGCGMISFNIEGRHQLLTLGGAGERSTASQHGKQYISSPRKPQQCYTSEVFSITVFIPPGIHEFEWIRPKIVGDYFSPRAFFSADTLSNNQGVVFGGQIIDDNGDFQRTDDVFLLSCKKDLIEFKKIVKPSSGPWPSKRYHHATTIITSLSNLTDQVSQHLVVLGGHNTKLIADCWIMNITNATWSKIDLPENVTCRQKHCIAGFSFSPNLVWLIVSGGYKIGSEPVDKSDNLVLVKLVFNQNTAQWVAGKIILYHSEIEGSHYYQMLFECILEDRRSHDIKGGRKMSLTGVSSSQKEDVGFLVQRLQDAEKRLQDAEKRLQDAERRLQDAQLQNSHLEEQLHQLQEEKEMMRSTVLKESNDKIKKKEKTNKELKLTIKQLKEEKDQENTTQQVTLEKCARELSEKNTIIDGMNLQLSNFGDKLINAEKFVKKLEKENVTFEKSLKKCEFERETNILELQNRDTKIVQQKEEMETMKQMMKKEKEESEKIIAENSDLHDKAIKEKLQMIEKKDTALKKTGEELELLQQQLEEENQQLMKMTSKTPQCWMVDEKEVKMTDQCLGKGSYGEVKLAIFRGTKVAAKCLHNSIMSGYHSEIFTREMGISSKMHHPNIVQFIGATNGGVPVLLYELMETSLSNKMPLKPLLKDEILHVTTDILSALAYLHAWKPDPLIHRDVSSPNVLMELCGADQWRSKLSDFGSANLQRHTKTEMPGNQFYAAPEAHNPKSHTPSMDMYSLGILIMEMVNNKPPELQLLERKNQIDIIEWELMKAVVIRCTSENHTERPQAIQLLEEFTAHLSKQDDQNNN